MCQLPAKKSATVSDVVICLKRFQDLTSAMDEVSDSACEKLKATNLSGGAARSWVAQAVNLLILKLKGLCAAHHEALQRTTQTAARLVSKVPNFGEEAHYREVLGKLSQQMAADAKTLSSMAALMRTSSLQLSLKCSVREGFLHQANISAALSQLMTTCVTLFACLTLVRSPILGSKTETAKKTAKQVESLLYTLLSQDLPATPVSDVLPDSALETFWAEAVEAVSASVRQAGLGLCS